MRIELQWAFSREDMRPVPCEICGTEFEPRAVLIRCDPHGLEACEECLRALSGRKAALPEAPWPTWEEYEALATAHPEPMFASAQEVSASERTSDRGRGEWPAYDASWLWRVEEADVHVAPTIIHRAYTDHAAQEVTHGAATVEHEGVRALIVFRSEEEAEKYCSATGKHPAEEGFRTANLDLEELGHVLEAHSCTHVAMPEPWTEKGGVDFFEASAFLGMLRETVPG